MDNIIEKVSANNVLRNTSEKILSNPIKINGVTVDVPLIPEVRNFFRKTNMLTDAIFFQLYGQNE